jgi:hypothetical protein
MLVYFLRLKTIVLFDHSKYLIFIRKQQEKLIKIHEYEVEIREI